MGRDKALLSLGGVPLAVLQARKLERVCGRAAFVGKDPRTLAELPYPFVPDGTAERAALHGIVAALDWSPEEEALVLAVDVPGVPEELLSALLRRLAASGAAAVVPSDAGRPQPLAAAWSRRALPALRRCAAAGNLSLRRALAAAGGILLSAAETEGLPGWVPNAFRNVNTPEEHRAVEEESP